jgi:methylglutaconyl-CoA hydratase
MTKFVHQRISQGEATITLSRPDVHNAFNEVVIAEMTAAFKEIAQREEIRAVVLKGEGKCFCAGADIGWMKRTIEYTFDENVADADHMANMLRTIRECPKPVIARVHGPVFGGGIGLLGACDMAVALESAIFSLSEVKLGIIPAVISPYVLEKIGAGAMRRYALTAERFDAAEARRIGLINEVAPTVEALDACIADFTRALLGNGPLAMAACKRVLRDVLAAKSWDDIQAITTERTAKQRVAGEGQEGLNAFLEKRKPAWIEPG